MKIKIINTTVVPGKMQQLCFSIYPTTAVAKNSTNQLSSLIQVSQQVNQGLAHTNTMRRTSYILLGY